ncbi:hypothetical protein HJFPF1_03040 [Paramyrothecium foliicola]|nr:hypothetical protein HJFPF1_03040 [Paramyrothecium foliicola]
MQRAAGLEPVAATVGSQAQRPDCSDSQLELIPDASPQGTLSYWVGLGSLPDGPVPTSSWGPGPLAPSNHAGQLQIHGRHHGAKRRPMKGLSAAKTSQAPRAHATQPQRASSTIEPTTHTQVVDAARCGDAASDLIDSLQTRYNECFMVQAVPAGGAPPAA